MWVTQHNNADWDCFKTPILQEILKIQNPLLEEHCAFSEVIRLFQEVWCARNKLLFLTVQQKLYGGLRMVGIPALDLWDLVTEVFYSGPNQSNNEDQARGNTSRNTTSNKHTQNQTKVSTQHDNFDLSDVDCVPSNKKKFSRFGAMLYFFWGQRSRDKNDHERPKSNNETCIQNPQSCFWFVVWQNWSGSQDSNQVCRQNTQFADILTKGNFTRYEWNTLLHLLNISHFSLLCCSQNLSVTSGITTMAKRMQEQEGEQRIVAKSKPTTMNLVFTVLWLCSLRLRRKAQEYSKHPVEQIGPVQGNLTQKNTFKTKGGKKIQFWMQGRGNSSRQKKTRNTWIILKSQ